MLIFLCKFADFKKINKYQLERSTLVEG